MGIWDSICSVASGVGSAISSGLSSAASWCGEKFSTLVSVGKVALDTVGGIAGGLLQGSGLFGKQETPENMGDRALQADAQGIFPDKFHDFGKYMESLRNFELDPEKSKKPLLTRKFLKDLKLQAVRWKINSMRQLEAWQMSGCLRAQIQIILPLSDFSQF